MLFTDLDAPAPRRWPTMWAARRAPGLIELAGDSDVLLLAVKPAALDAVAEELGGVAPALLSCSRSRHRAAWPKRFRAFPCSG